MRKIVEYVRPIGYKDQSPAPAHAFVRKRCSMPQRRKRKVTRRDFLATTTAAAAVFTIVPRHVLGGPGHVPPSDTFGGALIGVGGRGPGTYSDMCRGLTVKQLAQCDVRFADRADNKTIFTGMTTLCGGRCQAATMVRHCPQELQGRSPRPSLWGGLIVQGPSRKCGQN